MRAPLAVSACCLALGAVAAPESFVVDAAHTFPSFGVSHLGIATQRGRFERTSGRIMLDRESGQAAIEVDIEAASISTGNAKIDALLRGEDFFDVERHPRIAYRATTMAMQAGSPAAFEGELTLLGVTRPVTLRVERFACTRKPFLVRTTCGADASAVLSRTAFGMKGLTAFVGDEVRIDIQVEAVREEVSQPAPGGG